MTQTRAALLLLPLTASLLAACSSTGLPGSSGDLTGHVAPRYDYAVTVPLQTGDTPASIQAALGGTVLAWNDSGCTVDAAKDCQALVGMNGSATPMTQTLGSQSLDTQRLEMQNVIGRAQSQLGRAVTVEVNKDRFSAGSSVTATMGGARALWAGGSLLAWSGGARALWAGGEYQAVPQNTQLWTTLHLQQAQALAPNLGAGVTVAVIDTGLDLNHAAFQGSLTDPSTWKDYYGGDAVPQDEGTLGTGGFGHGTNVAGIILQIAPKAKIMPLRVLGPDGSGDVTNVVSAINWAVGHGAQIINLSLGSLADAAAVENALTAAMAKNVLAVTSAGNANSSTLTYPAQRATENPLLLSVGSVDATGAKSSFSNYSYTMELMAPGENVFAPAPGNLLASWSGTSQAAPMVAGGLALALGQPLKIAVSALTGNASSSASTTIFSNATNYAYGGQLGSGLLNLETLLRQSLK